MTVKTEPSAIVVPFGKHKGTTVVELLAKDPEYAEWIMAQGWVAERFAELHAALASRGAGADDTPEHNALQARFLDAGFRERFLCLAADKAVHANLASIKKNCLDWEWKNLLSESRRAAEQKIDEAGKELGCPWSVPEQVQKEAFLEYRRLNLISDDAEKLAKIASAGKNDFQDYKLYSRAQFEARGIDVVISWDHFLNQESFNTRSCGNFVNVELKPSLGDDYPTGNAANAALGLQVFGRRKL